MKPHSLEDTDLYMKGRGWGNLGTGLRFKRTPFLEPGELEFNALFCTVFPLNIWDITNKEYKSLKKSK